MTPARPGPLLWGLLVFLGIIWGASFPAAAIALKGFGPVTVAALRITLAALVLVTLAFVLGHGLPERHSPTGRRIWLHCLGMAIFTNALPFSLLNWGQLHVTSGFAGITMAMVPLAILPMAHFLVPGEAMHARKIAGFGVGFAGTVILIGPAALLSSGADLELLARLACFAAAMCYAIGSIVTRRAPQVSQISFAAAALLLAALIMLPTAMMIEGFPGRPTAIPLLALGYLGLVPTALAALILVHIIKQAGPSFLSLVNYQVPVWAALMGVAFLGEALPLRIIGALALILAGLAISQARGWPLRS